jgi:ribonuclease P/MRP protein subunit POP7
VSTKTPFMCAVKRVQKLLGHAEKRATSKVNMSNNKTNEKARLERVVQAQEALRKEEVSIMATGRAIDKAMSLEKWFKEKEEEYEVKVRTKAVIAIDDILPGVDASCPEKGNSVSRNDDRDKKEPHDKKGDGNTLTGSDAQTITTTPQGDKETGDAKVSAAKSKSMRRKKRVKDRKHSNGDELPSSRTRYINGVEIVVSLR